MREERITVTLAADGTLRAETRGLKGTACETELAELLEGIASIHDVMHTSEAREKQPEVRVDRTAKLTRGKP
jgi:uncharacterized protein YqgV (UPF0045/DUF77 family)